jgi:L-asparaginase II
VESTHPWSAVVVDAAGHTLHEWGNPDLPTFYRSAVKPFQATVALEAGADLPPEYVALACASHSGTPAQVAIVAEMLRRAGLDETALQCPPALPLGEGSRRRAIAAAAGERRLFHNCSGKHAGFLAGCVAAGWPTDGYLKPDHPLQQRIMALLIELTGVDGLPPGVDGCGAPTLRGTLRGLGRAFATLSVDPRFAAARTAMSRYPALTSGNDRPDGRLAMWWAGPAKGGAQGLVAAARNGVAVATKSHGGSTPVAVQALIEIADRLDLLPAVALDALAEVRRPAVIGGGREVGVTFPDAEGMG